MKRIYLTFLAFSLFLGLEVQNAVNAQTPVNAQNAVHAQDAVNAQNAVHAQDAVNAQNAVHAQNAVNAQNAVHAQNAVYAQNAIHAQNLMNEQKALEGQVLVRVRVSNPSKEVRENEPVVLDLREYAGVSKAVVMVDGKEIPSQLDDLDRDCVSDELCFLANLGKKETKEYEVRLYDQGEQNAYPARTFAELVVPSKNKKLAKNQQDIYLRSLSFDKRTKDPYHFVHSHGVCFESDLVAMRVYFDNRQTIDLYGKVNKGLVLEATQFYPSEQQIAAGSGDDCLWVGNTYGLGALRGWDGSRQLLLDNVKYQEQRVISEGPLRAIVEVVDNGWVPAPGLKPINAVIRYTIYAGHRDFDVDVRFNKDASDYQFATGLINVKGSSEMADAHGLRGCYGSDWPTGKDDGKHKLETVGLGIYVPKAYFVSQQPANANDYTLVVKPVGYELKYKLAYTSANETYGFKGEKEWYEWLKNWKKMQEQPLVIKVTK